MEIDLDIRMCGICRSYYVKEKVKRVFTSENTLYYIWVCQKCFSKLKSGKGLKAK